MVHAIPGRVRLNCRALSYLGEVSKDIEDELNKMDFIKEASVNTITKNSKLSKFTTIPALASIYLTRPIAKSGLEGFKDDLKPNADALTTTAIVASLAAGNGISALTIILLSEIAELLTSYTMAKTRDSIKGMMSLKDEFVWKVEEDGTIKK